MVETLKPKLYKLESKLVLVAKDDNDALGHLEWLITEKSGEKYRKTFYDHVMLVEIKSEDELPSGVVTDEVPVNGDWFVSDLENGKVEYENSLWDCISYESTINDYLEYANKK